MTVPSSVATASSPGTVLPRGQSETVSIGVVKHDDFSLPEPTKEQLDAAKSAYATRGGTYNPQVTSVGKKVHIFVMKSKTSARITDEAVVNLPNLPFDFSLNIDHSSITDVGLNELAKLANLSRLVISDSKVTNAGVPILATFKRLKFLNMGSCPELSEAGFKALGGLRNLEGLAIGGSQVIDESMVAIKELQNLNSFSVSGSLITDEGVKGLSNLKYLTSLGITDVARVTDKSVEEITKLKGLKSLRIYRTGISPMGVGKIKVALPCCDVWD